MNTKTDTQTCYRCRIEKPLDHFILRIDDRYYNMCRVCVSEVTKPVGGKRKKLQHTDTHRTCYLCERFMPVDNFTRRTKGNYFSACKDCNRHVFAQRRRARKNEAEGYYTLEEWNNLVSQFTHCPDCKRKWEDIAPPPNRDTVITADHIIPISKGGNNFIENIRPLCYSCNSKKGNKL